MAYHSRSAWTSTGKGGVVLAGSGRTMTHIYIHYPGQGAAIGRASTASTRNRLEGYRRQHKNINGWADIAYNLAVDQNGDVWELRGIDRQSGANGGTTSNRHGQAILVLVGNGEAPTAECVAGIKDAVARIRAVHPSARTIRGHQQSPDASTACPGVHLMRLVRSGGLEPGAAPSGGVSGGTSKPMSRPAQGGRLAVDGRWGRETTKALQRFLNSRLTGAALAVDGRTGPATWRALQAYLAAPYRDGVISRQSYRHTELGNGISPNGWEYTGRRSAGSQTIVLLQKWVKAGADGVVGGGTTSAVQRKLNEHGVGM